MIHENGYFYTDKGASAAEEKWMRSWHSTPLVVVHGEVLPSLEEIVHASAIKAGLPEIKGYYGYDFREHKYIRLPDADKGEPDQWPSRKLEDILSRAQEARPV